MTGNKTYRGIKYQENPLQAVFSLQNTKSVKFKKIDTQYNVQENVYYRFNSEQTAGSGARSCSLDYGKTPDEITVIES